MQPQFIHKFIKTTTFYEALAYAREAQKILHVACDVLIILSFEKLSITVSFQFQGI